MTMNRTIAAGFFAVMTASSVMADITPIGSFDADSYESFESIPRGFVRDAVRIFDGQAQVMSNTDYGWIHATSAWGFRSTVRAADGGYMLGSTRNGLAFVFDRDVSAFGAMFATNSNVAGGKIRFFDADGVLLDSAAIQITDDAQWTYNAWGTDEAVRRIEITGNYFGDGVGGFVMMDNASVAFASVPAPGVLGSLGLLGMVSGRRRKA